MYLKIDLTLSHVKCFNSQAMKCPPKHQLAPATRQEYWLLVRDSFIPGPLQAGGERANAAGGSGGKLRRRGPTREAAPVALAAGERAVPGGRAPCPWPPLQPLLHRSVPAKHEAEWGRAGGPAARTGQRKHLRDLQQSFFFLRAFVGPGPGPQPRGDPGPGLRPGRWGDTCPPLTARAWAPQPAGGRRATGPARPRLLQGNTRKYRGLRSPRGVPLWNHSLDQLSLQWER